MKLPTEQVSKINHVEAGGRVRALREKNNISLRRLAAALKKSPAFVSDLERGRRNWTSELFAAAEYNIRIIAESR
jgi:transcriptional regulator with XRE-family HTH domain